MRIISRIYLLSLLFLLIIAGVGGLSLFWGVHQQQQHDLADRIQHNLLNDLYRLKEIAGLYQQRPLERYARRWQEIYQRLNSGAIQRLEGAVPSDSSQESSVLGEFAALGNSFNEITERAANLSAEESYLQSQMGNVRIHLSRLQSEVDLLLERERLQQQRALRRSAWSMGAGLGLVILLMFFYALRSVRRIRLELNGRVGNIGEKLEVVIVALRRDQEVLSEQQSRTDEIVAVVEELDAAASENRHYAEQVSGGTESIMAAAGHTRGQIDAMELAMTDLQQKITTIAEQIQLLSNHSGQIQGVIDTMSGIAAQTNMLALNAAVEASRAGEFGKGFVVVSQEIRKLANKSRSEAERVETLIAEIQRVTSTTVMAAAGGREALSSTTNRIHGSGDAFLTMAEAVEGMVESIQMISLNTRQQSTAFSSVTESISKVREGADRLHEELEQSRVAIESFVAATSELEQMV